MKRGLASELRPRIRPHASGSILMWAMLDKDSVSEDSVGAIVSPWIKALSGMGRQAKSSATHIV